MSRQSSIFIVAFAVRNRHCALMRSRSFPAPLTAALGLLLILLSRATSPAQTPCLQHKSPPLSEAPPQTVGISPERLARIDVMCDQAVRDGVVPGMVALVARHGRIVYYKAFGQADNEAGRPLKRDDIFRIASQ